jgi:hypothetical protein
LNHTFRLDDCHSKQSLKSSRVAKQPDNLTPEAEINNDENNKKTAYLTGHLKGLMGLLAKIPTRRGFGQTTGPL